MFKLITIKNLVLIGLVPFMFACSKSKFSAVKTVATAPAQTNNNDDDRDHNYDNNDDDDHTRCRNCNRPPIKIPPCHTCGKPPIVIIKPPVVIKEPCHTCGKPPIKVPPCHTCKQPVIVKEPVIIRPPVKVVVPECEEVTYDRPDYTQGVQGINLWVVMDGSKSNLQERATQLRAILSAYDKKLARQIPVTVSVITGHSRKSPDSVMYNGRNDNFFFVSDEGEPAVIKFSPGKDNKDAEAALIAKVMGMRTDNSAGYSDGGELLSFNLLAALKPERLEWARSVGALKDNYLLQVAFITDENDICSPGRKASTMVTMKNGRKVDREELSYYENCQGTDSTFSRDGGYSREEYSKTLFNALHRMTKERQGNVPARQVLLTGYMYNNPNSVPEGTQNEFGNGLVQLVDATGGRTYDLAQLMSGRMTPQDAAVDLAQFTNSEADLFVRFQIKKNGVPVDASEFDNARTEVYVGKQRIKVRPEGSVLVAEGRCENQPVRIKYCRRK